MKNKSVIAFMFSLILPGAGQIYNRTFFRGLFWLIVTPVFWIYTGYLAAVCHFFSAVTAYNYSARRTGQEEVWPDL